MWKNADTISAIATARAESALSIVRVSGPKAVEIAGACFSSDVQKSRVGYWKNPQTGEHIDQVVVLYWPEKNSYTGEHALDIICHGGLEVTDQVLRSTFLAGSRLAEPGEFTCRAVLNGKMDLPKAEAVLELIKARTPMAAKRALRNIEGAVSQKLNQIESETVFLLANLEAAIDFTGEDIEPLDLNEIRNRLAGVIRDTEALVRDYMNTSKAGDGLEFTIVGKPNAGKSSLFNSLLGRNKAIVSNIEGTTRDLVDGEMRVSNIVLKVIDTAGLRNSTDIIEAEGVERARLSALTSHGVFFVVDSSRGLQNEDVEEIKKFSEEKLAVVFSKADLKNLDAQKEIRAFGLEKYPAFSVSAQDGRGIENLRGWLKGISERYLNPETDSILGSSRQFEQINRANSALKKAESLFGEKYSPEFVAFELRFALQALQEALGKDPSDDILDRVFKEFCIGK